MDHPWIILTWRIRIVQQLPRLEALDLSNIPEHPESSSKIRKSKNPNHAPWTAYLPQLQESSQLPMYLELETLKLFTYLEEDPDDESLVQLEEVRRIKNFIKMYEEGVYDHKSANPQGEPEDFEELFGRLLQSETDYRARTEKLPHKDLETLEKSISESNLCRRLKWLGIRDWRLKPEAKQVCRLTEHCISLTTLSIRGNYDRDYRSNEITSAHNHVCVFVGGVINMVPATVNTIELRLSLSFIRFFMEQLHKHKPHIKRVGVDLGAWMQIYPLRQEKLTLKDTDIRSEAIAVARRTRSDIHQEEIDKHSLEDPELQFPDTNTSVENDEYRKDQTFKSKQRNVYRNIGGTIIHVDPKQAAKSDPTNENSGSDDRPLSGKKLPMQNYDFLSENVAKDGELLCPLNSGTHTNIVKCLDDTVVDTLPRMLKRFHLARRIEEDSDSDEMFERVVAKSGEEPPGLRVTRRGAEFFPLDPEPQERSTDPIDPMTMFQRESPNWDCGDILTNWTMQDRELLYAWVERTFKWRPVIDWDW